MKRRVLLSLFSLLCPLLPLAAQEFKAITLEDGLSNMVVRGIAQDDRGQMWFASNWGLQCYDGSGFRNYNIADISHGKILDNRFLSVRFDAGGRLWATTRSHMLRYDPVRDDFDVVFTLVNTRDRYSEIREISVADSASLYVSATGGLYRYDIPSGESFHVYTATAVNSCLPVGSDLCLLATPQGVVFFDRRSEEVCAVPQRFAALERELAGSEVRLLRGGSDGEVWAAARNRVCVAVGGDRVVVPSWNSQISYNPVRDIIPFDDGYLLAADGLGLVRCDAGFGLRDIVLSDPDRPGSLTNEGVYDLFADADGRLWVATFGGGVNYYDPNRQPFVRIGRLPGEESTLMDNNMRAIFEASDGSVWIGTKRGVSIRDPEGRGWRHITREFNPKLHFNTVLAFAEDPDGNVWISTFAGGVEVYDRQLRLKRQWNRANSGLSSDDIFAMYRDSDGDIWLSGENGVLSRFDFRRKAFENYDVGNVVRCITQSRSGEIIVSGSRGVQYVNKYTGRIREAVQDSALRAERMMVYSVAEDASRNLWMATEGNGLQYLDVQRGELSSFTTREGLSSNVVYAVLRGQDGNIWMSGLGGISCFDPVTESFTNYSEDDGMPFQEFMYCAYCALRDGRLIFGGPKGAVMFAPGEIRHVRRRHEIVFRALKLFNHTVVPGAEGSPLAGALDLTRELTLRHDQNSFTLDFSAVNLDNPAQNRYQWILEGFDAEWSPLSAAASASYTNVNPGRYVFRVRSTTDAAGDVFAERQMGVVIRPPLWQTFWAYLIYAAVLLAIVWLVVEDLRSRLREHQAKDKIDFFVGVAHDIKTPLSLILSPLVNLRGHQALDRKAADELDIAIRNSERLQHLINQLLNFEKVSAGSRRMQVAKYRIEPTVLSIARAFEPAIRRKGLELVVDFPEEVTWLWFDMDKFEKIVFNILGNAVKYTPEGGRVGIRGRVAGHRYRLEVWDTGIGIPDKQKHNIFRRYFRADNAVNSHESGSGVGLLLAKELIAMHGGDISFVSKAGRGTTFTVTLPLGREHFRGRQVTLTEYGPDTASREVSGAVAPGRRFKVLVAEDNVELLDYIRGNLESCYTVLTATDGRRALEAARSGFPDIIVTDFMMPEMNGAELCRAVKGDPELCHIPVVILTALSSDDHKVEGFNAGADSYIEKPFDMMVLLSRLSNLLDTREMIRERILKGKQQETPGGSESDREFLARIGEVVLEHLSDTEFMVDNICAQLGVSYPVLYRRLKNLTGRTPVDHIKEIRLRKAEELLRTGVYNVSEVAYMTGFSQPNYFSKVYKRFFGYSPNELIRP